MQMKRLTDPAERQGMKVQSVTLSPEDIERLDQILDQNQFKTRSAAVRACIAFTHARLGRIVRDNG